MGPGGEREWRRSEEGVGRWGGRVPGPEGNTKRPGEDGRRGRNGGMAKDAGEPEGITKNDLAAAAG